MISSIDGIKGKKITIMGLGLNGGGMAAARFLSEHGAIVTATDLRDENILKPTIDQLTGLDIRYVLGRHEKEDFCKADLVIKNPAVHGQNEYLECAPAVETDISLFLRLFKGPILAVTGSKGKSTTVSALFHILKTTWPSTRLGGNITVSPLSFLDELSGDEPVILELSSWQLADIRGKGLLHPAVSCITNIMPDHQNYYSSMDEYALDKAYIFTDQNPSQYCLLDESDSYTDFFLSKMGCPAFFVGHGAKENSSPRSWLQNEEGWMEYQGKKNLILPKNILVPGAHNRFNLLMACSMAVLFGMDPDAVCEAAKDFPGLSHRLEYLGEKKGIKFYNDTAATIPQALMAAAESFPFNARIICGGTDKNIDFSVIKGLSQKVLSLHLLAGTATEKMIPLLAQEGTNHRGPFDSLQKAFNDVLSATQPGETIVLSPGCASFGMFLNEFDRGNQFKALVKTWLEE